MFQKEFSTSRRKIVPIRNDIGIITFSITFTNDGREKPIISSGSILVHFSVLSSEYKLVEQASIFTPKSSSTPAINYF